MGDISSSATMDVDKKTPFGHQLRAHFLFDDDYINLNHGSFGTYPRQIQARLRHYQNLAEARPDQFIRYDYPRMLDQSRELMANYLNAALDEVVFVPNATIGVNTILRNLRVGSRDCIIYFASIYGACEKSISYVCETTGASSFKVEYTYPIGDDDLCDLFQTKIRNARADGFVPRLALFDVVSSLPGVRMPFEKLVEICRQEGVLSLIDGAHAPGLITLDLQTLQPDFFLGNCHKWLFAPRGCAVLYVPLRHQGWIRSTLPTSHGFIPLPVAGSGGINNPLPPSNKSEFVNQFEFVGSLDNSPYLCIADCFDFIEKVLGGKEAYQSYIIALAAKGGTRVAQILGTEVMDNAEKTLTRCSLSNVRLPIDLSTASLSTTPAKLVQYITETLVTEHSTFLAVYIHAGALYVRLSGQVYLEMQDFEWIGQVLKQLCARIQKVPNSML